MSDRLKAGREPEVGANRSGMRLQIIIDEPTELRMQVAKFGEPANAERTGLAS